MSYLRGRVYAATLGPEGETFYLIVSNNHRNRALRTALAVRLTTSPRPRLASIVELGKQDPCTGRILCDDIVCLWEDDDARDVGALSPATMDDVADGLAAALGLD